MGVFRQASGKTALGPIFLQVYDLRHCAKQHLNTLKLFTCKATLTNESNKADRVLDIL